MELGDAGWLEESGSDGEVIFRLHWINRRLTSADVDRKINAIAASLPSLMEALIESINELNELYFARVNVLTLARPWKNFAFEKLLFRSLFKLNNYINTTRNVSCDVYYHNWLDKSVRFLWKKSSVYTVSQTFENCLKTTHLFRIWITLELWKWRL